MPTTPTTEFPVEYGTVLDEVVAQASFTSKYNVQGAEFVSARTVKVPEMVIDGGTVAYDRFQTKGSVAIQYTPYTLDRDRQKSFYLDALDVQDQPLLDLVKVASEFERLYLVPENDTYFFGKAKAAAKTSATTNLTAANIREELRKVKTQMKQNGFNSASLYMSSDAMACLENAIDREFAGEDTITDTVGRYNVFDLYEVPDDRLGADFIAIANGGDRVIRNVIKRAVTNLFAPGVNQNGDGYELQMRWVYGVVALANKNGGLYANKGASAPDSLIRPTVLVENVTASDDDEKSNGGGGE